MAEIFFWTENLISLDSVNLLQVESRYTVYSDASDTGAAGFIEGHNMVMHKTWNVDEQVKSSTWREVKAIQLCIRSFSEFLKNSSVSFFTDNQNAVSIISKGSRIPELQILALDIFKCCLKHNISVFITWLPRDQNEQADLLSRVIDIDDWGTSDEFFTFIDNIWGPHTYDRFANYENAKISVFSSKFWNPGTSAVDAFSCQWSTDNNWLVPPVALASQCINHLIACKAQGTLIVPKWTSSAFWPLIFTENMHYRPYVKDVLEFYETDRIFVPGNNRNSIFANGTFTGSVLAIRLCAL